jgi:glycosyltransferase involved in cell wall biosynthesis
MSGVVDGRQSATSRRPLWIGAGPAGAADRLPAAAAALDRPHRLAAVTSHPVQYQAPLFRLLARHPRVDLTVCYGARWGLDETLDEGFGRRVRWDVPLVDGYRARFPRNVGRGRGFFRIVNPGVVTKLVRGRYDAVFIHGYAHATAMLAYAAARLSRTPILLRTESELVRPRSAVRQGVQRAVLGPLLRGAAGVLAIGSRNRAFYAHHGVAAERVFWTPYCVDNDFFAPFAAGRAHHRVEVREQLGLDRRQPIVLFAGKLVERKRPGDLLEVLRRSPTRLDGAAVVFVGDGALRARLERQVAEWKLGGVRFAGFQNQSAIGRYYAAADVVAVPSAFETWGLVVNEAMACGAPVVASDGVVAAADLVVDGRNGAAYPAGDVDALARCLHQVLDRSDRGAAMGTHAREHVAGWSLAACVSGIVDALDCVGRRRVAWGDEEPRWVAKAAGQPRWMAAGDVEGRA